MKISDIVTVLVDRLLEGVHPEHPDLIYSVNYGYLPGVFALDGEEQDTYILGVDEPGKEFTGRIVAIIHRKNDVEDKACRCAGKYALFEGGDRAKNRVCRAIF